MSGKFLPRFSNRGGLLTLRHEAGVDHVPAPEAQTGGRALPVGPLIPLQTPLWLLAVLVPVSRTLRVGVDQ